MYFATQKELSIKVHSGGIYQPTDVNLRTFKGHGDFLIGCIINYKSRHMQHAMLHLNERIIFIKTIRAG